MKPNDSSLVGGSKMVSKESKMLSSIEPRREAFNPQVRGYHAVYREGEVNHCPGCGRTHWIIGRVSAECAFCATALPLSESHRHGQAATVVARRWPVYPHLDLNAA